MLDNIELVKELKSKIVEKIEELDSESSSKNFLKSESPESAELHYHTFNEDYYIIGYYQAEQWLNQHNISPWEAISYVVGCEIESFGECTLSPSDFNSEQIVNKLVYFLGEEILSDYLDLNLKTVLIEFKEDLGE